MNTRQFVRIRTKFEHFPIRGYVFDAGPKFFLLCVVNDRLWFDGFECFRIKDVLSVEPDPYADFADAALKKRKQRRPRKPKVDLDSVQGILHTAGKVFPLLTIHMEKHNPDVCYIGQVCEITVKHLHLRCIDPHAQWDSDAGKYRLSQITRIGFGADYEDALHLVGGGAPT